MLKITFHVPGMHCAACVMRLESLEDGVPGIRSATASYHKQTLVIEYDERIVDEKTIRMEIQRLGYQAA